MDKMYWWDQPKNNAHESIFSVIRHLQNNQAWVREGHLRNMRLYGNLNVLGLTVNTYSQNASVNPPYDRLSYNIVQSMVDTVTQKIAQNRPRPMFLTEGGDYKQQKKAKLLNKFIDGQFYKTGIYNIDKAPSAFRDGAIFGSGFMKIYREGSEICAERTFTGEIIVDENEGVYGNPRAMFQVKYIPKEYVSQLYPKFKDKIKDAPLATPISNQPMHRNMSEAVLVVEAWHLPANKESKDGRHIICLENVTLTDEVYEKTYFPFVKIDWSKRILGYLGQGLAEQLTGLQVEINKLLRDIQLSMHLVKPKVLLEMGSKIIKSQMNNEIGGLLWYSGTKPEIYTPPAISEQWFQHLQNLYQKGYEIAGVSQLAASSKKPAGLNSGKALREYNDIETERFIIIGQAYEQFFLDSAKMMIDLAKEIAEENKDYTVLAKDGGQLTKIKWSDINLEEDEYMMQLYPTNYISKTPAGRLQDVTDLSQAGFIDKPNALKLLDFPDLESYTKFANAKIEDIQRSIDLIIDDGDYKTPEPFQDLQMGVSMFQSAYLWARSNGVPEDRLEMLRRWSEEANVLLQKSQPQPQPAPQGMPAVPQAAPTSDMMPMQGA